MIYFLIGSGIAIILVIGLIVGGIYYIYKNFFKGDGGPPPPPPPPGPPKKPTPKSGIHPGMKWVGTSSSESTQPLGYFTLENVKKAFSDSWINLGWKIGSWDSNKLNTRGVVTLYKNKEGLRLVPTLHFYAFEFVSKPNKITLDPTKPY